MTPRQYAAAVRLRRFGQAVRDGASVTGRHLRGGVLLVSSRFYEQGPGALGMSATGAAAGRRRAGDPRDDAARARWARCWSPPPRAGCARSFFGDRSGAAAAASCAAVSPGAHPRPTRRPACAGRPDRRAGRRSGGAGGRTSRWTWWAPPSSRRSGRRCERSRRAPPPLRRDWPGASAPRRAIRAVGTACGANPVSVASRATGSLRGDGGLGGYRWGLTRKQALLVAREQAGHPAEPIAGGSGPVRVLKSIEEGARGDGTTT